MYLPTSHLTNLTAPPADAPFPNPYAQQIIYTHEHAIKPTPLALILAELCSLLQLQRLHVALHQAHHVLGHIIILGISLLEPQAREIPPRRVVQRGRVPE